MSYLHQLVRIDFGKGKETAILIFIGRLFLLLVLLLGFVLIGAPLQRLARARNWKIASWIPVWFCRSLASALQIRVHIHGLQSSLRPQLVVANHVSWTDILVLGSRKAQGFLAKKEVGNWPLFGMLARLQGTVFVDRQWRRGIPGTNQLMAASMLAGNTVVLFAEATTSDGTRIKHFHSSHFAAARDLLALDPGLERVWVQPVAIRYGRRDGLTLGRAGRADLAWYGSMTLLPHVLALLASGPVDCDMYFVPPLPFERGLDRKLMARRCEDVTRLALAGRLAPSAMRETVPATVPVLLQSKTAYGVRVCEAPLEKMLA